jgi:hypothetical protein
MGLKSFVLRNEYKIVKIYSRIKGFVTKNVYCVVCSVDLKDENVNKCPSHFCDAMFCLKCFIEQKDKECPQCHAGRFEEVLHLWVHIP